MRKIDVKPEARHDTLEIADYLAANASDEVAARFVLQVEDAYQTIAEFPGIGVARTYNNPSLQRLRMWPVPRYRNYLIFYRVSKTSVEIA